VVEPALSGKEEKSCISWVGFLSHEGKGASVPIFSLKGLTPTSAASLPAPHL
jgi:hypothetical protein